MVKFSSLSVAHSKHAITLWLCYSCYSTNSVVCLALIIDWVQGIELISCWHLAATKSPSDCVCHTCSSNPHTNTQKTKPNQTKNESESIWSTHRVTCFLSDILSQPTSGRFLFILRHARALVYLQSDSHIVMASNRDWLLAPSTGYYCSRCVGLNSRRWRASGIEYRQPLSRKRNR